MISYTTHSNKFEGAALVRWIVAAFNVKGEVRGGARSEDSADPAFPSIIPVILEIMLSLLNAHSRGRLVEGVVANGGFSSNSLRLERSHSVSSSSRWRTQAADCVREVFFPGNQRPDDMIKKFTFCNWRVHWVSPSCTGNVEFFRKEILTKSTKVFVPPLPSY